MSAIIGVLLSMLGKNIASIEGPARRILQRLWGIPDIHTRQKWMTMWPLLANLSTEGLRLLDAGCGPGQWSLELAARRPSWAIKGIDIEPEFIREAETARQKLGLKNVRFEVSDFLEFEEEQAYDAILCVCSVHTCMEIGKGNDLFHQFHRWLKPGGVLLVLAPRRLSESPFARWLPRRHWRAIFSRDQLFDLCRTNDLEIEQLVGCIGKLGTVAKQIDFAVRDRRLNLLSPLAYPMVWSLVSIDRRLCPTAQARSLWWVLVARRASPLAGPANQTSAVDRTDAVFV